jgi:hypothetical protein
MRYAYQIVATNCDSSHLQTLQAQLNENGSDGWRVTHTFPSTNGVWLLLEKELTAQSSIRELQAGL